jgi:uncharacterized protein YggE
VYSSAQKRRLQQYQVVRQIEVDLRELDRLGSLLERATDLGVNQISSPQLDSSRRQELERDALAKAVAEARLNAQTLVKAAGGRLGRVRSVSSQSSSVAVPLLLERSQRQSDNAAATYQRQLGFAASVQVRYELVSE